MVTPKPSSSSSPSSYNDNAMKSQMECRATSITILVREWWAALVLISTFQDVTKYTIGGIISISTLRWQSRRREDGGSYKDFIVNEALQEEINLWNLKYPRDNCKMSQIVGHFPYLQSSCIFKISLQLMEGFDMLKCEGEDKILKTSDWWPRN